MSVLLSLILTFGIFDYVKIDLKSLCVVDYNNVYKFGMTWLFMKDKQLKEWGYWIDIAKKASRGLLASSNFLEKGILINNDIKQSLKQFLESCDVGRKAQSSFEKMLKKSKEKMLEKSKDPEGLKERFRSLFNYGDVFEKISEGKGVYDYLEDIRGLEAGDKTSAARLKDFYSKMLKYSSQKIYECSRNI